VSNLRYVLASKEAMGDDHVRLVDWVAPDGGKVHKGMLIAAAETTKAAFEIEADSDGYLFQLAKPGDRIKVGEPLAVISSEDIRPDIALKRSVEPPDGRESFTTKALELLERHRIPRSAFAGLPVVRASDVEDYLRLQSNRSDDAVKTRFFGPDELSPERDWDEVLTAKELLDLQSLLTNVRRRLKAKFNRHVPLGTLLHDRWDVAKEYGFGEGTSVYDECLILGDVKLGKKCWVGPFAILDGNFASLRIGDHCSIGSGSHIYTHHAIDNVITEGQASISAADTIIEDACFISPMVVVGPGTRIGGHSFVAAGSYVQGQFPEYSYIAGTPARRLGRVEIRNQRVILLKEEGEQ